MKSVVALGFFDGVHLGHRAILKRTVSYAMQNGLSACAFTFAAASLPVKQGAKLHYIYPDAQKLELLEQCGIQSVYSPDFFRLRDLDGERFCQHVLQEQFQAKTVFCGKDFRFGARAAWNFQDLCQFGEIFGFTVEAIEPICYDDSVISSTRIRQALLKGDVSLAAKLLGESYAVCGNVIHGAAFGHTRAVPTINLAFAPGQLIPKYGVYVSLTHTKQGTYPSVTDIGVKPTVSDGGKVGAETFLLDFSGNIYAQPCKVELLAFLREERCFADADALYAQIHLDTQQARVYFERNRDTQKIL